MKTRRQYRPKILLGSILLGLMAIPLGITLHVLHQYELNTDLITAIKANDTHAALAALNAGADANTKENGYEAATFPNQLKHKLERFFHNRPDDPLDVRPTALLVLVGTADDSGFGSPPENIAILKGLLEHGANVNVRDASGSTPLLYAALFHSQEGVRLLIKSGADVNAQNSLGVTPLIWATADRDTVKILLANHADVNRQDIEGRTALDQAIDTKNTEYIAFLKKAGAKPGKGRTTLSAEVL